MFSIEATSLEIALHHRPTNHSLVDIQPKIKHIPCQFLSKDTSEATVEAVMSSVRTFKVLALCALVLVLTAFPELAKAKALHRLDYEDPAAAIVAPQEVASAANASIRIQANEIGLENQDISMEEHQLSTSEPAARLKSKRSAQPFFNPVTFYRFLAGIYPGGEDDLEEIELRPPAVSPPYNHPSIRAPNSLSYLHPGLDYHAF